MSIFKIYNMGFTERMPCSLSKLFQLFRMPVMEFLWLLELSYELFIFTFPPNQFPIGFKSVLIIGHWFQMPFLKKKALILFALWQDKLSSWKMTLSSPNQFSVDGIRQLSRILMYTYALTDFDCHLLFSFKWRATEYPEWLGKFTTFLQSVIFHCFIWTEPDKRSNIIALAKVDSWFMIHYHFHPIVPESW